MARVSNSVSGDIHENPGERKPCFAADDESVLHTLV